LLRVCQAADALSRVTVPSSLALPDEHPRLGGWREIAEDGLLLTRLAQSFPWAYARLTQLVALEEHGLAGAKGHTLAHFDLFAHNTLLTNGDVFIVDWPHARSAAAFVDTVMLLSTAKDGAQSERLWRQRPVSQVADPDDVTGVLVAHAGSCAASAVWPTSPGLEPITAAKAELAGGALAWLKERWVD
jgi:hypothetical protein